MIKRKRKNRGFTLMETMIYIALFGIIMSGAVVGTYNLLEGGDRNVASAGVQEEGTFLIRKISWALSGGTAVSISGGGSILTINTIAPGVTSPLVISGVGSNMTIARGGGASIVLNSDRFKISNVLFTYIASINGRPPSVSGSFLVGDKSFTFRDYLRQ
jgi:prepilin-type N-terminal cleavage/methylation domain-containing protein